MDAQVVKTARDSLSRCKQKPEFLDRFYELFMGASEEIRKKFERTDFARQKGVLSDSLFLMLTASGATTGYARAELDKLAKRHSRNDLDIKPEWYSVWLDTLMETVAEIDPEYSEDVETAWRDALKDSIDVLIAGY